MMSSYLVDSEAFPRRAEGARWGDEGLLLRVGGGNVRVEGLSSAQRKTVEELWAGFVTTDRGGDACPVSIFRVDPGCFRSFDRRGWNYALDFEYGPTYTYLTGFDLLARIEWEYGLKAALWVASETPDAFHGAAENFLRVFVAHALLLEGGLLVHSASVLDEEGVRLFIGRSGAGKSTVSRLALSSGRAVLSDDLNLMLPDFSLAGSPFLGDVGSRENGTHALLGIYRLEKGAADAVHPLGEGEALASLLSCSSFVNRSPFLEERLWSNLSAVVRTVPAYALTFRREGGFWPLLKRGMPC